MQQNSADASGPDEPKLPWSVAPVGRADEVLPHLLRAAREHLGMDVAFLGEFAEGNRVFRYVDSPTGTLRAGASDPVEDTYCMRVVDGRLPQLITDARQLPEAAAIAATEALPVGAHISVPLVLSDGTLYGTFCCFSHHADESLGARDLAVVKMFADVASQSVESDVRERRRHEAADRRITSALESETDLTVVYQPVVALDDGALLGVEALSRFPRGVHPSPDLWFAEAASIGRGAELEALAVRRASVALQRLPDEVFLAVNVSPEVVVSGRLDDVLADVDARRLVLEMTEHAVVEDYEALRTALGPFRERGGRIAVDDAGAGYASFLHILRLRPEWIKIDRAITQDVDVDWARSSLTSALVRFAAEVGATIIAEGIETASEMNVMRSLGVTAGQGYHIARPGELGLVSMPVTPRTAVPLGRPGGQRVN